MNATRQSLKVSKQTVSTPAPGTLLQRQCACGNHTAAGGECTACARTKKPLQRRLSIGTSNDPLEREADQVAKRVLSGHSVLPTLSATGDATVRRQEAPKEKTDAEKYQEGLEKLGEAFLETPLGKTLVEKLKQDALVKGATQLGKDILATWPGRIYTGEAAVITVAALAANHKALPVQIPEIPLDIITPGLSVKLTYKGPVDKPTEAMITFSYREQAAKNDAGKTPLSEADKYRAETARIAADQAKFRANMRFAPGSPEDLRQQAEDAALREAALKYRGGLDIAATLKKYPWLTAPQPQNGLRLSLPKSAPGSEAPSLFGDQFKLKFPGEKKPEDRPELQKKLRIGANDTPLEREADRVAEHVVADSSNPLANSARISVQRTSRNASAASEAVPDSVDQVLASSGRPLDAPLQQEMETRFGHDFSRVRIHVGGAAERSAHEIQAKAYTAGHDIVFGDNQFQPDTRDGRHLLAHELAHVLQQTSGAPRRVRRQGMADVRLAEACNEIADRIHASAAYKALDAKSIALTEEIITELAKWAVAERYKLLTTLETLFITPPKAPVTISVETKGSTVKAAAAEQTRLAKPAEKKNTGIEEKASGDPVRSVAMVAIKGKFGGGTYYVDRRSATDILVKAKVFLHSTGTGSAADVNNIKAMEDAIEKAASTKGYIVDIEFVPAKTADSFDVEVDPSRWETATNWSGGEPWGYAHELHHMFAFELDRYNYIEAHAQNESMQIDQRLIWFRKELGKPANYNDPTSIMNRAAHPNDSDVCTVAGMDMKACMDARQKVKKP